jgi:pyruvate/2-oxoglutarate/acetoin dehydrogenase E1 component
MDTRFQLAVGMNCCNMGMRPIVEVMTVNFSLLAFDQIVNNAATCTCLAVKFMYRWSYALDAE